jgi:putative membrane protein
MKNPLADAELERIKEAVVAAERRTSGEIVVTVVDRSGHYDVAIWRAACGAALLAIAGSLLIHQFYQGWGLAWLYTGWGTALLALIAGAAGALLTTAVPALRRTFAGSALLDRTVHQRAMQAFVEDEVFTTKERTGILLFISLLEHRIEVLGDSGINRLVTADDWVDVIAKIREGIRGGRLADGILEAVEMCGHLLEKSGVAVQADDTDELPNKVRVLRGI